VIGGLSAPQLSDAELAALNGDAGDSELTDEELQALLAAADELDTAGQLDTLEPAGAGATLAYDPGTQMALELAFAQNEESQRQIGVINTELDRQRFEAEKLHLINDAGVPPFLVELAKPLLKGSGHVVDLANDDGSPGRVDAGQVMRQVLNAAGRMTSMLDLSVEAGSALDEPQAAAAGADARGDLVSRYRAQTGL
jgi:hypothetical protein